MQAIMSIDLSRLFSGNKQHDKETTVLGLGVLLLLMSLVALAFGLGMDTVSIFMKVAFGLIVIDVLVDLVIRFTQWGRNRK